MIQRSLSLFESMIKSEATRKTYSYHLAKFLSFYKIRDCDSLATMSADKLQVMLEDYLLHMRKQVSPNSIPTIYAGLELFLRANDKNLNFWKLHKMFPSKIKRSGFRAYTTDEVKDMLEFAKSRRNKAIVHVLASTGCRIGALHGLILKYVEDMPEGCKAILLYKDSEEEYWSFLTPEASKALSDYLKERENDHEYISENSPLFRMDYKMGIEKPRQLGYNALFSIMYRLIVGSKIQRIKKDNRFDVMMDHGFRKRFNGILKMNNEINSNIAEKLMAHKRGLDSSYLKPTREQCFNEFVKAIPDLTISESERLLADNKNKDETIKKMELEKNSIKKYDQRLAKAEKIILHLLHKISPDVVNPDKDHFNIE